MQTDGTSSMPVKAKWPRVLAVLVLLVILFLPVFFTFQYLQYVTVWQFYQQYVDNVSRITGLNNYLITAGSLLLFVPFFKGVKLFLRQGTRLQGSAILTALAVLYNVGLFAATRNSNFSFDGGEVQKWYAVTPEGLKVYDRPGVDPKYGITLEPVRKEMVRSLELLEKGQFKPINPENAVFFNPFTRKPEVWFYRGADGVIEFYDVPGYHPLTGTELKEVTDAIVTEWRQTHDEKQKQADLVKRGEFKPIDPERAVFFDPVTGDPQVWFSRQGEDTYSFYAAPGFDPGTGAALEPVTREVLASWKQSRDLRNTRLAAESSGPAPGGVADAKAEVPKSRARKAAPVVHPDPLKDRW